MTAQKRVIGRVPFLDGDAPLRIDCRSAPSEPLSSREQDITETPFFIFTAAFLRGTLS